MLKLRSDLFRPLIEWAANRLAEALCVTMRALHALSSFNSDPVTSSLLSPMFKMSPSLCVTIVFGLFALCKYTSGKAYDPCQVQVPGKRVCKTVCRQASRHLSHPCFARCCRVTRGLSESLLYQVETPPTLLWKLFPMFFRGGTVTLPSKPFWCVHFLRQLIHGVVSVRNSNPRSACHACMAHNTQNYSCWPVDVAPIKNHIC